MVFFQQTLTRTVVMHPQFLGRDLKNEIFKRLKAEVEGMSVGESGYLIAVVTVHDEGTSKGLIDHLTGFVKYRVSFDAVMFRPFRNEVMDLVVSTVSQTHFLARAGPLEVLVTQQRMPTEFEFNTEDSSFTNTESGIKIKVGTGVRVRIIGATLATTGIAAIGAIDDAQLGVLA